LKTRPSVNLADLVGTRVLSGRGMFVASDRTERVTRNATVVILLLDDTLYAFHEDPSDSSLAEILVLQPDQPEDIPGDAFAVFDPIVVEARLSTRIVWWRCSPKPNVSSRDEVLYLVRESDGLVIAEIGTISIDDYYPSFHHTWTPEGTRPEYLAAKEDIT
jgi:hypothetical protein